VIKSTRKGLMNKTEKAQRNKKSLENLGWKTSKKTPCEL
jgi:hypothetical protein